jgi:hypothetical protein
VNGELVRDAQYAEAENQLDEITCGGQHGIACREASCTFSSPHNTELSCEAPSEPASSASTLCSAAPRSTDSVRSNAQTLQQASQHATYWLAPARELDNTTPNDSNEVTALGNEPSFEIAEHHGREKSRYIAAIGLGSFIEQVAWYPATLNVVTCS